MRQTPLYQRLQCFL